MNHVLETIDAVIDDQPSWTRILYITGSGVNANSVPTDTGGFFGLTAVANLKAKHIIFPEYP